MFYYKIILLNLFNFYRSLKENIIRSQLLDRQQTMSLWFDNLMEGIERNLLIKNRDRFTQNLSLFRKDINGSLKSSNLYCSSINDMIVS